ncbi:NitT/TauT family transport system ATP-binding protein [Planifilum fulgidum]|jgi:NitT/TauT family transport system ATP-binding protein|uniref:NitT/TauT family transport system ATP-binding protein n=1 Tax=Planifilum fulgidum TaxID=201973 RepID=A0A1I2MIW3_9BACL|nr:ABC transporter ATP-binding protein [Planifilum fulgidum]MBO2495282.1 ABC transporter ATP-binding protein [Bacillota bacterium]MBO2532612.1 ABC transporter ATP-binding protein [Thermoactinomycetaceae bacterium]SFF90679.1 NitT/TauT family transport system ATP-binding protein [Planifilum fulgidum]
MTPIDAIEIDHVTKTYLTRQDERHALGPITLHVAPGEMVAVVGPSGCGKSTLLSLIAGLMPVTSGEIRLFGEPVKGPSPRIGYMLQRDGLLEWRTVEENIALGLEIRGKKSLKTLEHARYLLGEMGLGSVMHHYPSQLSGGMRQRVALVRTMAVQPDILLLDEPFSAVDYQNKLHLERLLASIRRQHKITTVLITHDLEEALALADRIVVLSRRPGRIRRMITLPEEVRRADPLEARSHPLFRSRFNELWKELEQP